MASEAKQSGVQHCSWGLQCVGMGGLEVTWGGRELLHLPLPYTPLHWGKYPPTPPSGA